MNKENVKNKIMSLIKNDEVEIKSKWKFIVNNYVKLLVIATLGILSVFVVSLIAFISSTPTELLMLIVAILIGLYLILNNEEKLKTIPRIYIWLLIVTTTLVLAYIINILHMHDRMMKDRRMGPRVNKIYKHYKPELFKN